MVKNLPAMQEIWARTLGRVDPLEKGRATHSSILAWRILCSEEPDGLQSMGSQRVRHDRATNTFALYYINPWSVVVLPLQYWALAGGLSGQRLWYRGPGRNLRQGCYYLRTLLLLVVCLMVMTFPVFCLLNILHFIHFNICKQLKGFGSEYYL